MLKGNACLHLGAVPLPAVLQEARVSQALEDGVAQGQVEGRGRAGQRRRAL